MLLALRSLWEQISATAAITEAADSLVSTATVLVSASSSITEAADSLASTATVLVTATAAITEAIDTVVSTAAVVDSAVEAGTEDDDSVTATATVDVVAHSAGPDDGFLLLVDGTSELLLDDDIDFLLLEQSGQAIVEDDDRITGSGFLLLVDGVSSVLLANGVDFLLLEGTGEAVVSGTVAAAAVGAVSGGGRKVWPKRWTQREIDREWREYLKRGQPQPKPASIAALVDQNAQSSVLSEQLHANDDEEAIMVLLLAA